MFSIYPCSSRFHIKQNNSCEEQKSRKIKFTGGESATRSEFDIELVNLGD